MIDDIVEILKSLDHPNIVRAMETFDYHNRVFIVLELCSGGDLYTRDPYTEEDARKIISCLFQAVRYDMIAVNKSSVRQFLCWHAFVDG